MASVIVIGGGVAGLTAAHELAERGYSVTVYEQRAAWGGKARSQPVPGSGTDGRRDLPGEHVGPVLGAVEPHRPVVRVEHRTRSRQHPERFERAIVRKVSRSTLA